MNAPAKLYRTIMADPPWYQSGGGVIKRGADRHYPLMKEAQITDVMVKTLEGRLESDAHMYMWVTNNQLPEGLRIIEALGFRYITNLVWAKTKFGLGRYFRGQHELCLFGVKGQFKKVTRPNNDISSLLGKSLIRPGRHSEKPPEIYDLVERRSYGPYLEMFARSSRSGWDSWGYDAPAETRIEPLERPTPGTEG